MALTISPMREDEISKCAQIATDSQIGLSYQFTQKGIEKNLREAFTSHHLLLTASLDSTVVGFAWVDPKGAFSSAPYLRLLAVKEGYRGHHIGSSLLEAFELQTSYLCRDYFLLVSDFNTKAISFYEKNGFVQVGLLPEFAKKGINEIIMVKKWKK